MMFDAVYLAQDPVVNPKPHRGEVGILAGRVAGRVAGRWRSEVLKRRLS